MTVKKRAEELTLKLIDTGRETKVKLTVWKPD